MEEDLRFPFPLMLPVHCLWRVCLQTVPGVKYLVSFILLAIYLPSIALLFPPLFYSFHLDCILDPSLPYKKFHFEHLNWAFTMLHYLFSLCYFHFPSVLLSSLGFVDIFRPFVGYKEVRLVSKESRHVSSFLSKHYLLIYP